MNYALKPSEKKQDHTLVLVKSSLEGLVLGEGLLVGLLVTKTLLGVGSGVRVEAEHDLLVAERVLLLDDGALGDGATTDRAENALDLRAVDELVEVGLGNAVLGKEEVALELRGLGGAAVDGVEGGEGVGRPDDETAKVTTRGELEEVEGVDVAGLDTGDVAESLDELLAILGRVVDDERTAALDVAAVPQLTLASAELAGVLDLLDLGGGTDGVEEVDGLGGLLEGTVGEGGAGDDERDLGDGTDTVATGEEKGSAGRSSDGGNGGETPVLLSAFLSLHLLAFWLCVLLAKVDLLVPLAPDLGGREHATGTALVTEGGLASAVSTTTGDTGDTGDSATWCPLAMSLRFLLQFATPNAASQRPPLYENSISRTGTPGLSRGLVTSLLAHGVRLTLVLGHASVDSPVRILAIIPIFISASCVGIGEIVLDNVGADGRLEDIGQGVGVLAGSTIGANDRDGRTRHLVCVVSSAVRMACKRRLVAASESSKSAHFPPTANVGAACARGLGACRSAWQPPGALL